MGQGRVQSDEAEHNQWEAVHHLHRNGQWPVLRFKWVLLFGVVNERYWKKTSPWNFIAHPQRSTDELFKAVVRLNTFTSPCCNIKVVLSLVYGQTAGVPSLHSEPDSFMLFESLPLNFKFSCLEDTTIIQYFCFSFKSASKLCAFTSCGSILEQLFYPGNFVVLYFLYS